MKEALALILQDRPVWIGAFGTLGTVMLESIHLIVGIGVGLTTIIYLVLRMRKDSRTQRDSAKRVSTEDSGGCRSGERSRK